MRSVWESYTMEEIKSACGEQTVEEELAPAQAACAEEPPEEEVRQAPFTVPCDIQPVGVDMAPVSVETARADEAPAEAAAEETFKPRSGFRYGCYLFVKRCFDILSSFLVIVLLSWLILLCILIKWLEDFHNPIYVSKRVGKNGKIFNFYKIRTMCPNAESMKQKLIDEGLNEADGPAFKMKNDPRITKVGKIYRKLSLDELPQLFNILNGTMSVVGPRPPIPSEVEQYTEYQKHRLDVKGGLLCLWQIQKNRNSLDFDEWVRLDLEYIQKQSIWLDLKIIFKGAYMVVFDRSGE